MSDFFNRLDLLRKKRGEALTDIASFLGISGPAIHCWKKGGLPKPDKLRLLAEHYGTTVEFLLSGRPSPEAPAREEQPGCSQCGMLKKRIDELEAQLTVAYETINNQSIALAQGRTIDPRGPPVAAPTVLDGGSRRRASTSKGRRAEA